MNVPTDTPLSQAPRRAALRHYDAVVAAEVLRLARQLRPPSATEESNPDHQSPTTTASIDRGDRLAGQSPAKPRRRRRKRGATARSSRRLIATSHPRYGLTT